MIYHKHSRMPKQNLFYENVKYQAINNYLDCYTVIETKI
jgi:hypothetical protein